MNCYFVDRLQPKLSARIEKLVPCDDFPNTPVQFQNVIINQVGFNQFSLWGNISITEPFDRPIRVSGQLDLSVQRVFDI